jgi:CRISPR/Cas system-associated exonuclease Cas4 (RecB family)
MSRQVIRLHTINEWFQVDPAVRSIILQSIKLKDKLNRFLVANQQKPPLPPEGAWMKCNRCDGSGQVHKSPRHPGIHPSQVVGQCLLKVYWQLIGLEETSKFNAKTLLIFDIGHAVHHMFQTYGQAGAWGSHYVPEIKITDGSHALATELFIEGHADADTVMVIDDIPNAPIYEVGIVHEYKTINTANFGKLTRPKPEHKQQAIIYSAVLNRPVVVYLYLNKDNSSMSDFPVEFDPGAWEVMKAKIQVIIQHYDSGVDPPASPSFGCGECGFFERCEVGQAFKKSGPGRT